MGLFRVLDTNKLTKTAGISKYSNEDIFDSDAWSWSQALEKYAISCGACEPVSLAVDNQRFDVEDFPQEGSYVAINLATLKFTESLGASLLAAVYAFEAICEDSEDYHALLHVVAIS
jgi:hypothetical protein